MGHIRLGQLPRTRKWRDVVELVAAGADVPTDKSTTRPAFLTAADLCAGSPEQREPIIDGLLRRGEVANVISGPKANKSWLLLHLALCVATGRDWLGFRCRQGRVLLLDYELERETLSARLRGVSDGG